MTVRAPVEISPGTEVRGFVLEAKLGAGGFATVYRARRGERRYALKFIRTTVAGRWAQREVDILQRLSHPNVVGFEGCGFWPDDTHEYSLVIMDYVEGRRLDEWAQEENPDARQVALKLLGVGRALAALHREKVVHRDVKEPNILVRASDGEAVLVDFGVAGGEQLRRVTRELLPPGTPEYRSPEAWRFFREHARGEQAHYEPGPGDDVYALGVVLYWLLTGRLPCEGATLEEQVEATLHQVPVSPRELNPRVPQALSAVCMRMLEKWPEQRYRDGAAVCAAVEEALAGAAAEWGVPLCEGHEPDRVTTQEELSKAGDDDGVDRALRRARHAYERPRRGRRPAPPPAEPPAPPPAPPALPAPGTAKEGGTAARVRSLRGVVAAVAVGLVAAAAVGLGAAWLGRHLPRASSSSSAVAELPGRPSPRTALAALPEPTWEVGWKVAPPWKPPEATGPLFFGTEEAALEVRSPERERGEASVKTPQQKQQKKSMSRAGKAASTGALCLTVACTAPQVRPMPPPEACPAGAVEAMKELDLFGPSGGFEAENTGAEFVTLKEGEITLRLVEGSWGKLPYGTTVSGRLLWCGEERMCGRFTQATVREGERTRTWPICAELLGENMLAGRKSLPGATENTVKTYSRLRLVAARRFGCESPELDACK